MLLSIWLLVTPAGPGAEAGRRAASVLPNIIVIVTDDQRFDTLWAMPNVRESLVAHGMKFRKAFVVNPSCCPSRASILTGLYSHGTGVYRNRGDHGGFAAFDPGSTVATWLHDAGYRTALIGKYLNGYAGTSIPPGWDVFDAFNEDPETGLYFDYSMNLNGTQQNFGEDRSDYSTSVLSRLSSSFVADSADPFFLYLAPRAPHPPAIPAVRDRHAFADLAPWRPPSYNEADVTDKPRWVQRRPPLTAHLQDAIDRFRIRQYRVLLAVDRMIGRLIAQLEEEGRLGSTVLIFTSDNGIQWGEHRLSEKGVAYEESIRVPMVIRYDRLVAGPALDDHLVLNIDLAPTLAALAGLTPPSPVDGSSLVPLLDHSVGEWRNHFLIEHVGSAPPTFCAVRSTRDLYVAYGTGAEELYDLRQDPWELTNVFARDQRLRDRMLAWLLELCQPPPPDYQLPTG